MVISGIYILTLSLGFCCYNIGVPEYLKNNITQSKFSENVYFKPENITFNKKKNLIHIHK